MPVRSFAVSLSAPASTWRHQSGDSSNREKTFCAHEPSLCCDRTATQPKPFQQASHCGTGSLDDDEMPSPSCLACCLFSDECAYTVYCLMPGESLHALPPVHRRPADANAHNLQCPHRTCIFAAFSQTAEIAISGPAHAAERRGRGRKISASSSILKHFLALATERKDFLMNLRRWESGPKAKLSLEERGKGSSRSESAGMLFFVLGYN